MTTALCQGDGCRHRTVGAGRAAAPTGSLLCAGCHGRLAADLSAMPRLYRECERVLAGRPVDSLRERTSGGCMPGLPFNGAAADVRATILSTLGSWSGLVAQERGLTSPARDVPCLAAFLGRHLAWLAGHPAAGEISAEIARLVRTARRVVHPNPTRTIRLGHCPEPACRGGLAAVPVRPHGDGGESAIVCTREPAHRWPRERWSDLSLALAAPAPQGDSVVPAAEPAAPRHERWLAAADVALLWHASMSTVYRLASEEGWRRRTRAGRAYYNETDVRACFERRGRSRRTARPAE
jgi:hypothetical protein